MDVCLHSHPPEVSVHHIDSVADSLMAFPLWNSKTIILFNFLGTMIVGTMVYFNLTAFLSLRQSWIWFSLDFFHFLLAEVVLSLLSSE